jgi:hypothetical protein
MSAPQAVEPTERGPAGRRGMVFRRRSKTPMPTPEQSRRQSHVVRSAWRHFGEAAPVIAFLNTRHDRLDAQPLRLAIESDGGLERVEALLEHMTLEA